MRFFTHASFGLLIGVLLSPEHFYLGVLMVVFGSLIPDADYPFSVIGSTTQPLSFWIHEEFGHRTITHSILFAGTYSLFAYILKYPYLNYVTIGILSHILLDLLTNQGVMLLYPLKTRFILLDGDITTGSSTDYLLGTLFLFLLAIIIFYKFHPQGIIQYFNTTMKNNSLK